MNMADMEKVIKELEIQLDDLQKYADADETLMLTQEQAKEIIELLKEQEAKCLTKEELSGLHEQQFVWIEGKSGSLYCLRIIGIIEWENDVTAIQFDTPTAYVEKSTELYGSQYKIWTAQPTAEQREAMEWND